MFGSKGFGIWSRVWGLGFRVWPRVLGLGFWYVTQGFEFRVLEFFSGFWVSA